MRDSCYLILERDGIVTMRKNLPNLSSGQHAVKVRVEIEDGYFDRAIPEATLTIGEDYLIHPQIDVSLDTPPTEETP